MVKRARTTTDELIDGAATYPQVVHRKDPPPHGLVFFAMQSGISLITIFFCVVMMVRDKGNVQTFLPIMASVSAYWLPAPKPPAGVTSLLSSFISSAMDSSETGNGTGTGGRDSAPGEAMGQGAHVIDVSTPPGASASTPPVASSAPSAALHRVDEGGASLSISIPPKTTAAIGSPPRGITLGDLDANVKPASTHPRVAPNTVGGISVKRPSGV